MREAIAMRVLVFCDDVWHPARIPRAGLVPLAADGFTLDWVEHADAWASTRLDDYPVVILTKSNNMSASDKAPWATEAAASALRDYVGGGGGLLVIHSGLAGYREVPVLRAVMGGVFTNHPPQCPVAVVPREGHPLTAGAAPFTVTDEHYQIELDDRQADLFLTTTSEHGTQPGGWARAEGSGRVATLTPGHNLEVWLHPSYQALIGACLRWCGRSERH
jgi:type 1 glutamine amidotransferase